MSPTKTQRKYKYFFLLNGEMAKLTKPRGNGMKE